jgi:hypothetical protein
MCFCASASFGLGALLVASGLQILLATKAKRFYFFAAIPLFFGIQQIAEGFVWQALAGITSVGSLEFWSYFFLFFAYIVWPIYIPFSLYKVEKKRQHKKLLALLIPVGIAMSLLLLYALFIYPLSITVEQRHIVYSFGETVSDWLSILFLCVYALATVVPFFLSSEKKLRLFGAALFASALITYSVWQMAFTSVWCFFSAFLSLSIYFIVIAVKR